MTLNEKIEEALKVHLEGLIGGDELRQSEINRWVTLLYLAEEHKDPVKQARFFGLKFIARRENIREALNYLIYYA